MQSNAQIQNQEGVKVKQASLQFVEESNTSNISVANNNNIVAIN
jgi:hypothetical protein